MTIEMILQEAQEKISQIEGCPVTLHYIKIQKDLGKPRTDLLKQAICEAFQIPWQILLTDRSRRRTVVVPKKIFVYLNQVDLKVGPGPTGEHLGYDHTLAVYHRKKVSDLLDVKDEDTMYMVDRVRLFFNHLNAAV